MVIMQDDVSDLVGDNQPGVRLAQICQAPSLSVDVQGPGIEGYEARLFPFGTVEEFDFEGTLRQFS